MTDLAAMKQAAEAALPWTPDDRGYAQACPGLGNLMMQFFVAWQPAAAIAVVSQVEALTTENERLRDEAVLRRLEVTAALTCNTELQAALRQAEGALERAGAQFAHYAMLHYQKGTEDGNRKGDTNRDFAHEITAAFAAIKELLP